MALAAALLGWLFDGAEMGVFSMVGKPAVTDLMQSHLAGMDDKEASATVGLWFGVIIAGFLVGAATGGVLFGWLGDRIGRVRAMTLSVLTYALFTGLCFFATEAWHIGALRFIAALGMGGEWSLGVALVMEVWPNRSRAFMAGLIGAAANVGYMVVGLVGLVLASWLASLHDGLISGGVSEAMAKWLTQYSGWRIIMLLGTLPALLTFFIRIFVPESEKWAHENEKGSTSHWATQDLIAVLVGLIGPGLIIFVWSTKMFDGSSTKLPVQLAATVIGLAIATAGYTFPVIRYFQRAAKQSGKANESGPIIRRMLLGACLSGVALLGTWGSTQWAPSFADETVKAEKAAALKIAETADGSTPDYSQYRPREWTLIWISIGAVVGTLLAAGMGDWFGRRPSYFLLCILSLASIYVFYLGGHKYGPMFLFWAFVAGTCTASFYGWLPLYLPELFPTSVRATGQGFGFNFGRILAAIGVLQTGNLMGLFKTDLIIGGFTIPQGYPLACSTMSLIYLVGMVIIWFAPETKGKPLPE
jgi:MFS family permease